MFSEARKSKERQVDFWLAVEHTKVENDSWVGFEREIRSRGLIAAAWFLKNRSLDDRGMR
jgi:hypothetical protein